MRLEFACGATVHERWGGLPDLCLKGAFMSFEDALVYATGMIDRAPLEVSLIVVDHSTGKASQVTKRSKSATGGDK